MYKKLIMQETEPNFLTLMKVTESYRKFSFIRFLPILRSDTTKFLLCQTLIALIASYNIIIIKSYHSRVLIPNNALCCHEAISFSERALGTRLWTLDSGNLWTLRHAL